MEALAADGWMLTAKGPGWARFRRDDPQAITAAAAGIVPATPPRDWFYRPEEDAPTPLTVTKDGQVYGHMALWDSCHTGYPGRCVPPPRSASGYAYFNLGEVECDDGERVACGAITLDTLHPGTDSSVTAEKAKALYEKTGTVAAYVRAQDGRHGIWVAGALRAGLDEQCARDLMGAKPSGDWRPIGSRTEMIGILAVNVPGFPVPRLVASAEMPSGTHLAFRFHDQGAEDSAAERQLAVLAAKAEGIDALAQLANG